ncbi:SH3 domain-containing protein [Jannaschia sp. KMU-145]|uniref:SH3 domain-containing protein n=1 Tax=Jannaschia halovivens TaxID=3388667 RepID=UPI00396B42D4
MRLILPLLFCVALAGAATAQTLRNDSGGAVNLRGGPGTLFPVLGTLGPGVAVERGRCDLEGRWCLVSTDGAFGWVNTAYLAARSPTAPVPEVIVTPLPSTGAAPFEPPADLPREIVSAVLGLGGGTVTGARPPTILSTTAPMWNVTTGEVNLRSGPGTGNPVVGRLRPGEGGRIDVCSPDEQWCRIGAPDGRQGWVKATLIGERRMAP